MIPPPPPTLQPRPPFPHAKEFGVKNPPLSVYAKGSRPNRYTEQEREGE
jgi:hypothetical protein